MLNPSDFDMFKATTVLVVDDDPGIVRMMGRLLRDLGFKHVAHATDGASAVQKLAAGSFDLVISDLAMAPMSGLELLQRIRKDRRLMKTGFVMVTGRRNPSEVTAAKAAGADGYLLKPFNLANLKKQLTQALARHG